MSFNLSLILALRLEIGSNHSMDLIVKSQKLRQAFAYLPEFDRDTVAVVWSTGGLLNEEWINVCEHMASSAVLGYSLTKKIARGLAKRETSQLHIAHALLVHDFAKRKETELRKKDASAAEIVEANKKYFRQIAGFFSEKVASLASVTGDTGIAIAEKRPLTIEEKIVFYADCCTSGSQITSYRERFDSLANQFLAGGRYEKADSYFTATYGMNLRRKYDSVILPIEEEFSKRVGWSGPKEKLSTFLTPKEFHE